MNKQVGLAAIALLSCSGIALAYAAGRSASAGVPQSNALTYSGVLTDTNGTPLVGQKGISIQVWDAETAGQQVCNVGPVMVNLLAGNFRVALPDTCTTGVHSKADLWVEVFVDSLSMGRTKLGAVPYALEAQTASQAAGDLAVQLKAVQDGLAAVQGDVTQLKLHPQITVNGKKYSFGAYCGATPATDGLGVGGYSGAKQKCETACGTATAHQCSAEEAVRSAALGVTTTIGWVASGTFIYDSANTNHYVDDCNAYTTNSATVNGASWTPATSTFGPNWHACSTSMAVLCCD